MGVVAGGLGWFLCPPAAAQDIDVVASFKPIHSLVAGVMGGVGEPTLLVKGSGSPHTYALKPSDAAALAEADLIFWIGEGFEVFLSNPLETLAEGARAIELGEVEGLVQLPVREGGIWDEHADADAADRPAGEHGEGEHHEHGAFDGHVWLDPHNAKLMVAEIASALSAEDPAHAETYRANAAALTTRLDRLDAELTADLAPVKTTPFIVFHDAFQYFERRYGLTGAGSITVSPDQPPGARRLLDIRAKIEHQGAKCVFREPNFEPALVDTVIAGTTTRTGVLDPEGAGLEPGPELYFDLMRGNAESLKACLAASS
jgi:zinc transport system substrate-binding protein